MKFLVTSVTVLVSCMLLVACATQRYGRQNEVSVTEKEMYSCKDIKLELGKNDEFLDSVRAQRGSTSGAHVLGAMADFGIGNTMEGDAAEESGVIRKKELQALAYEKKCKL